MQRPLESNNEKYGAGNAIHFNVNSSAFKHPKVSPPLTVQCLIVELFSQNLESFLFKLTFLIISVFLLILNDSLWICLFLWLSQVNLKMRLFILFVFMFLFELLTCYEWTALTLHILGPSNSSHWCVPCFVSFVLWLFFTFFPLNLKRLFPFRHVVPVIHFYLAVAPFLWIILTKVKTLLHNTSH